MRKKYLHYLLIAVAGFAAFFNISGELCLDDPYILTQLPPAGSGFSGIFSVFNNLYGHADYRPVVVFTYALEQWMFGSIDPFTSKIINVILMILTGVVIYRFVRLLPVKENDTLGVLIALLFITHPVHSSVVSSLKNRDNLLSMLFGLLALYHCLNALQKRWLCNGLAALAFLALALFAKLDALSFLIIIPLTVLVFFRDQWKKFMPAFALLLIALAIRAWAATQFVPQPNSVIFSENPVVADWTLANRIAQTLQTLTHYVSFMIIPKGYLFYFGYNTLPLHSLFSITTLFYLLVNAAVIFAGFWFCKRDKLVSYGILFFYISLLYCSNFLVPVAGIIADRYAFIASLGYCIAITGFINFILFIYTPVPVKNISKTKTVGSVNGKNKALYTVIGFICLINLFFTLSRNADWENMDTLLAADMQKLENSFEANRIAASIYFKKGVENPGSSGDYIYQGLQYAQLAQKIYPGNQYINESIGQAFFNTGQPDAAIRQLQNTLQQFDTSRIAMEVLGDIYYLRKNTDSAVYFYSMSIARFPEYAPVYFKYMRSLFQKNDLLAAKNFTDELMQKNPEWYLPYQCASFYRLEQKDSLEGLRLYKISFDKGYRNETDAADVYQKLRRMGDTATAASMKKYMNP